jgi:hypothetical protein
VPAESAGRVAFVICAAALRLPRGGGSATRTPFAPSLRSAPVVGLGSQLTSAGRVRASVTTRPTAPSLDAFASLGCGGWVGRFARVRGSGWRVGHHTTNCPSLDAFASLGCRGWLGCAGCRGAERLVVRADSGGGGLGAAAVEVDPGGGRMAR